MNQNADKTGSAEKFHLLQPLRDLQSNWEVDVAKILEDYLLKICSGEITGEDDGSFSLNFAEAALLIQNSIQVYSRKVEYLYSLVLHALEFINQQSSQSNQPEEDSETVDHSAPDKEGGHRSAPDDQDDLFWASDDIPVEANITLDNAACCTSDDFVKPPADLLVLEGDCLDASGEGGELESYLLAKCDLYRGFILLDPCDAADVDDFLKKDRKTVNKKKSASRGSSRRSKSRKSFLSPTRQQGGSALKSQNPNLDQSPGPDHGFDFKINDDDVPQNNDSDFNMDGGGYQGFGSVDESDDDSDDDDIWKPLNPHEPGNLKIKPFKKVKARGMDWSKSSKSVPITKEFPVAPLHGPINSDLTQIWESLYHFSDNQQLESPPLYEKLRQSLDLGEQLRQPPGLSGNGIPSEFEPKNDDENGYDSENANFGPSDFDIPENTYMAEDHDDAGAAFPIDNAFENDDPTPDANLEDLCRRHLDNLLANIGEMEQQTELAVRVSTWKQRIEQNLEEQESLPPFDIHDYGEKVLEKLSAVTEGETTMSFTDVVKGQEKHDVARSFSALLQLVNNGNVDLLRAEDGNHDLRCYTGKKPFHIKLRRHVKRRQEVQLRSSKKKAKSPTNNVEAQVGKGKSSR